MEYFSKFIKCSKILFTFFQNVLEHPIAQALSVMRTRMQYSTWARAGTKWSAQIHTNFDMRTRTHDLAFARA
jgi:hypothetical protein